MGNTAKKKVVVIGFGGMGGWHVKNLLKSDVAEVVGFYDIKDISELKQSNQDMAKENGLRSYESFEAVLADPTIDLLTLAVPNDFHMPLAVQALEAGKNVISEKPVAMNSAELQKMIDASNRTGKLFTTHQNRRWDCDYLMMKELYASGKLGNVFCIESRYHGSRGIPGDWRTEKEHGGGMIFDWGVHLIDQMVGIVYDRKIEKVYCRCDHLLNTEVDDGFKLDLYFEGGLTARIEVSTYNFIALPRFYMAGRLGTGIINDWKDDCHLVCCDKWDEENVNPVITAAGLTRTMAPRDEKTTTESDIARPNPDVHDFYRNVCLAIDGKAEQIVTHAQLMRVMKIMEAAFESDAKGMPVEIDDKIC